MLILYHLCMKWLFYFLWFEQEKNATATLVGCQVIFDTVSQYIKKNVVIGAVLQLHAVQMGPRKVCLLYDETHGYPFVVVRLIWIVWCVRIGGQLFRAMWYVRCGAFVALDVCCCLGRIGKNTLPFMLYKYGFSVKAVVFGWTFLFMIYLVCLDEIDCW